ncbi:unnamed protein product, partial [Rotaria sp. Silwood2]
MQPTDNCYRAITEHGYASRQLPKSQIYEVYHRSYANHILSSAYVEKNGTESPFTAISQESGVL